MPVLCLELTEATIEENLAILSRYKDDIGAVELRADCLDVSELTGKRQVAEAAESLGIPAVFSYRGERPGLEGLLMEAAGEGFRYLEAEERAADLTSLAGLLWGGAIGLIRIQESRKEPRHFRDGVSIPKWIFSPSGTEEFFTDLSTLESVMSLDCECIVTGTGEPGFPFRVLAGRFGSPFVYCSDPSCIDESEMYSHIVPAVMKYSYRAERISAKTKIFGLIGAPLDHTSSPQVHNEHFNRLDDDLVYVPFTTDKLGLFLENRSRLELRALSVTMPLKRDIIAHLDEAGPEVKGCRACNTIKFKDEKISGWNTDVHGFLSPLGEPLAAMKRAVVIGAGGTARSSSYGLSRAGLDVTIINRTLENASALAEELGLKAARLEDSPEVNKLLADADIIVQATGVGMGLDRRNPLSFYSFRPGQTAYDVIYEPDRTEFLKKAEAEGAQVINGRSMLYAQAERQQEIFLKS